jgi:hypothetical protein
MDDINLDDVASGSHTQLSFRTTGGFVTERGRPIREGRRDVASCQAVRSA